MFRELGLAFADLARLASADLRAVNPGLPEFDRAAAGAVVLGVLYLLAAGPVVLYGRDALWQVVGGRP